MFMHMPTKMGVLVLVLLAACLGTYYVLVVQSEHIGDWRVYQGSGRIAYEHPGNVQFLDVNYAVTKPGSPLFLYTRMHRQRHGNGPLQMLLKCRTEWAMKLLVVVSERDGSRYEAVVEVPHTEAWQKLAVGEDRFTLCPGSADEDGKLDLYRLVPRVEFFDGSGVKDPSTIFSNRLMIMAPVFVPEMKPPDAGGEVPTEGR